MTARCAARWPVDGRRTCSLDTGHAGPHDAGGERWRVWTLEAEVRETLALCQNAQERAGEDPEAQLAAMCYVAGAASSSLARIAHHLAKLCVDCRRLEVKP